MKLIGLIPRYQWLIPTLIFSILVILSSQMHPLWGDEAETALFARSILKHGVPYGWDGTNIMGLGNAVVLDKNLVNHTSPWAQYYLGAFSFFLFGESTTTARLPFVVVSILSLPVFYLVVLKLTKNDRVALLSIWILALSVPFILFSFQARYYSLTTFASLVFVLSSLHLVHGSFRYKILFICSGILFFYSNYVVFISFASAVFLSLLAVSWTGKKSRQETVAFLKGFVALSSIILVLTVPWLIFFSPQTSRGYIDSPSVFEFIGTIAYFFFKEAIMPFSEYNGFPIFFLIPLIYIVIKKKNSQLFSSLLFLIFITFSFLFIMSLFTTVLIVDTVFTRIRYTFVLFPYFIALSAIILTYINQKYYRIGKILIILYLLTNVFTLFPFQSTEFVARTLTKMGTLRSFQFDLLYEMTHPYKTTDGAVAEFLVKYAQKDDTVFLTQDRDHEPLIFQLKDKIRFVNRVSLANNRIFPQNRKLLPRYVYNFTENPDWIIKYSKRSEEDSQLTFDYRPLPTYINLTKDYDEIVLPVFFADMTRPEMDMRTFYELKPEHIDQVFIYKKKSI